MLTLTTPRATLTASTDLELAVLWIQQEHGDILETECSPFEQHTMIWEYVECIRDLRDHATDGYRLLGAAEPPPSADETIQ